MPSQVPVNSKMIGVGHCGVGVVMAARDIILHEARMVNHLGDHRNLPLLFGALTKGEQLMLIMQFHGEKGKRVALSMAIKKKKLEKSELLDITKGVCEPLMSLTASSQKSYKKRYLHIAPEIVAGSGRHSIPIFSLGRIVLSILDLLPTATAISLRIAKLAILDNPAKRPSIEEIIAVL